MLISLLIIIKNITAYAQSYARRVKCGGCHLNLTLGSTGELSSPGFPGDYGANTDCLWLLGAQHDTQIQLRSYIAIKSFIKGRWK